MGSGIRQVCCRMRIHGSVGVLMLWLGCGNGWQQREWVWEPQERVIITRKFDLNEGQQLLKDMVEAAQKHSSRTGNVLEATRMRHVAARFLRIMAQAQAVLEQEKREFQRGRRNIIGTILGGLTGLVTQEELKVEQDRETALERQVKTALEQEIEVGTQLDKLGEGLVSFEALVERRLADIEKEMREEDVYRTRQEWREEILQEFAGTLQEAVYMALTGAASPGYAVVMLAEAGGRGTGEVRHLEMTEQDGMLMSVGSVEVGERTTATMVRDNSTGVTVHTGSRMFLISEHGHTGGEVVLGLEDVRLKAPMEAGCALLVRVGRGRYEVIQGGELRCTRGGSREAQVYEVGDIVRLTPRHDCSNRCVIIGSEGFRIVRKELGTLPSTHPSSIGKEVSLTGEPHSGWKEEGFRTHELAHNKLSRIIKDSKIAIRDMQADMDRDRDRLTHGWTWGVSGLSLSALTALMLVILCLRYKSRPTPTLSSPGDLPMVSPTGAGVGASPDNEVTGMGAVGLAWPLPS